MASYASETGGDLLVLGSGVAGMLVSERAMAAGRRVLMIERGTPMTFQERLRQGSHDDPLPFNRRPHVSPVANDPGTYEARPVYNLGGSTNHFYGNMPRMHPAHFEQEAFGGADRRWPVAYNELEPYYLEAERRLLVSGNSERIPFPGRFDYPLPPHRFSPSDRACETIFGAEHVMQVPTVRPPQAVGDRPACCGTNVCGLCPVDSKGTALNTVYPALRDRITLRTGLLVVEIQARQGRAAAVVARDPEGGMHRFTFRDVVVACNGIDSCLLLQRSPDLEHGPSLGRYYMDHPLVDVAVYGTGLDVRPGYGDSAQTGMITSFYERVSERLPVSMLGEIKCAELAKSDGDRDRDAVVRRVFELAARSQFSAAADLRTRVAETWRSTLYLRFLLEVQPLAGNTIEIGAIEESGQARPVIRVGYPSYTKACVDHVVSFLERRLPTALVTVVSRGPTVQHWLGATRMADDPAWGTVDRDLRVHGLQNLYVCSASTFPSGSSANPTLTLAALALRLGHRLGGDGAGVGSG